jgi:SAM-dependent methyltransferase
MSSSAFRWTLGACLATSILSRHGIEEGADMAARSGAHTSPLHRPAPRFTLQTVSDAVLLWIFRRFPAQSLIFKEPVGRAEAEYEVKGQYEFYWHFGASAVMFRDKEVLDVGSGFGAGAVRFIEYGARSVTGLEVTGDKVRLATAFARERGMADRVRFVMGTGEDMPLPSDSFDLITLDDVLEHVISPERVLEECWRVLRPGGRVAIVFPPYYDVLGGSHLSGRATSFPGLNLLFTTRALRSAVLKHLEDSGIDYAPFFRDVPTDKLWNLNGLTIRRFEKIIHDSRFLSEVMIYMGHLQYRRHHKSPKASSHLLWRAAYVLAQAVAQVPVLQEAFCARVCALLRK